MSALYEMIRLGDWLGLFGMFIVLAFVGNKMVKNDPQSSDLGARISAGTFVAYSLFRIVFDSPASAGDWFLIFFSALLAAALALTASWVLLPTLRFAMNRLITPSWRELQQWYTSRDREMIELRSQLSEEQHRAEQIAEQIELTKQEHSREKVHWSNQQQQKAQSNQDLQVCDNLRMECDFLYRQHALEIGNRLPESAYNRLIKNYLSKVTNPNIASKRAGMIKSLILRYSEQAKEQAADKEFRTIAQLLQSFQSQREEIEALPFDQDVKETLLMVLNGAQDQAAEAFYANQ